MGQKINESSWRGDDNVGAVCAVVFDVPGYGICPANEDQVRKLGNTFQELSEDLVDLRSQLSRRRDNQGSNVIFLQRLGPLKEYFQQRNEKGQSFTTAGHRFGANIFFLE